MGLAFLGDTELHCQVITGRMGERPIARPRGQAGTSEERASRVRTGEHRPTSVEPPQGLPPLSPALRELMEVLWASPSPCTGRTVHDRAVEQYSSRRGRAYSTTSNLLARLEARGYIETDSTPGRRHRYRPRVTRAEGLSVTAEHVVGEFCNERLDGLYLLRAFLRLFDLDELVPAHGEVERRTDPRAADAPRRAGRG